jgi:hypothetical protein
MMPSTTLSLFSERPEVDPQPYSFLFSVLAHGTVTGLLFLGIYFSPKVRIVPEDERFSVRHLDLHTIESELQRALKSPAKASAAPLERLHPAGGSPKSPPPVMREIAQAPRGPQTLIQPDLLKPVPLPDHIPLPTVVLWNQMKLPVKTLVPPAPQKPVVTDVKPSNQLPNNEQKLADLAIRSSDLNLPLQPIVASTTVPLSFSGQVPTTPAPLTTAQGTGQPTSATVISLSDSNMANGDLTLPEANESAASDTFGAIAPGDDTDPAGNGKGKGTSNGSGDTAGAAGTPNGSGLGGQPSTTLFTREKTGQFGAVVVGSTLEEKYSATAELWSGRLSYTVYIPVGLARNWILQFSLSRSDNATESGTIAHIDAPWPYSIVRPNLAPEAINADAIMVHGFIDKAGRFEDLALVFPPGFQQAQFVLDSLAQWQFRPAEQNGHRVSVEVLLIIPEESE